MAVGWRVQGVGVELWPQGPLVVVVVILQVEQQPLRGELFFVFVLKTGD